MDTSHTIIILILAIAIAACVEPVLPPGFEGFCGDGFQDAGEECDWGDENAIPCTPEPGSSCEYCSDTCELITVTAPDPFEGLEYGIGASQDFLLGNAPEWDLDTYRSLLITDLIVIKNGARLDNLWIDGIEAGPRWENLDEQVDYLESIGKRIKIHYLWSGRESILPDGFSELDSDERYEWILNHTRMIAERYTGRIAMYDVVNHPVRDGDDEDYLGTGRSKIDVITAIIEQTRDIDPDVLLVINEGGVVIDNSVIWPQNEGRDDEYYELLEALLEETTVDCIGFMTHAIFGYFNATRAQSVLDRFSAFDTPMCITEFDIMRPNEEEPYDPQDPWWTEQGAEYEKALALFADHPLVRSVIMWELSDGSSWRPGAALVTYNDPTLHLDDDGFLSDGSTMQRIIDITFTPDDTITRAVLYQEGGLQRGISIYLDSGYVHAYVWNDGASGPTFEPIHLTGPYEGATSIRLVHHAGVETNLSIDGALVGSGSGLALFPRVGLSIAGADRTRFHDGAFGLWGYHYAGNLSSVRVYDSVDETELIFDLDFTSLEGFSCEHCPTLNAGVGVFEDHRYTPKPAFGVFESYVS